MTEFVPPIPAQLRLDGDPEFLFDRRRPPKSTDEVQLLREVEELLAKGVLEEPGAEAQAA